MASTNNNETSYDNLSSYNLRRRLAYRQHAGDEIKLLQELVKIQEDEEDSEQKRLLLEVANSERDLKKRQMELDTIREQKPQRLSSPHKLGAVFILCDADVPIGTCFVARDKSKTKYYVLTTCHNLRSEKKVGDAYFLRRGIIRGLKGIKKYVPRVPIEVKLIDWNESDDWAILERTDSEMFEEFLKVRKSPCQREELIKTYHCPVSYFTQQDQEPYKYLLPCTSYWSKVNLVENTLIITETGLVNGSSGGAMIDKEGKVVAIFLDSLISYDTGANLASRTQTIIENPDYCKDGLVIICTPVLKDYFI